jgi:hypothetical protein
MKGSYFHNQIFTKGALKSIVTEARGFPRRINILCDNALVTGFGYQRNPVGGKIIKEVIADFRGPKSRKLFRVLPVAAVFGGIILLGVFLTQPIENPPEKVAPQVPYKAEVKLDLPTPPSLPIPSQPPLSQPIPSQPIPVPQVPVVDENAKVQQQVSELGPSKEIESAPESHETPLPEKQLPVSVEESSPKGAEAPKQEQLLTTPPPDLPKQTGAAKRIVSRGENVSRVLMDTYGYFDPDLMKLFKEANPHIKDVNRISVGEQLLLPQLDQTKSRSR